MAAMTLLPETITEEEQKTVTALAKVIAKVLKHEDAARGARDERDGLIAELRLAGWSLRQIAELTGYSTAQIKNISDRQGLVSTRATVRA